jgi:hypothetical protein
MPRRWRRPPELASTASSSVSWDKRSLGFGEKAIVLALRAPEGDFRDWQEIREWAVSILGVLSAGTRA